MAKKSGFDLEEMRRAHAAAESATGFSEGDLLRKLAAVKKAKEELDNTADVLRAELARSNSELEKSLNECSDLKATLQRYKADIASRDKEIDELGRAKKALTAAMAELGKSTTTADGKQQEIQLELEKTRDELAKAQEELEKSKACPETFSLSEEKGKNNSVPDGDEVGSHVTAPVSKPTTGRNWVLWVGLAIVLTVVVGLGLVHFGHMSFPQPLFCPVPPNHTCPPCKVCRQPALSKKHKDEIRRNDCDDRINGIKREFESNIRPYEEHQNNTVAKLASCEEVQRSTVAKLASCKEVERSSAEALEEAKNDLEAKQRIFQEKLASCEGLQNSTALALAVANGDLVVERQTIFRVEPMLKYATDIWLGCYEYIASVVVWDFNDNTAKNIGINLSNMVKSVSALRPRAGALGW